MLRLMPRLVVPSVALALVLPLGAQAASLLEAQLNRKLQSVAEETNKELPREIACANGRRHGSSGAPQGSGNRHG